MPLPPQRMVDAKDTVNWLANQGGRKRGRWGCCFVGRQQPINPNTAHGALQRGRRFQRWGCGRSSLRLLSQSGSVVWREVKKVCLWQPAFGLSPPPSTHPYLSCSKGELLSKSSQHQTLVTQQWHTLLLFRNWVWTGRVTSPKIELPRPDLPMENKRLSWTKRNVPSLYLGL